MTPANNKVSEMNKLNAYQVDDANVYAGATAEEAADAFAEDVGEIVNMADVRQLTDAELDADIPEFDENEAQTGNMTTLRAYLDEATAPGFLATSDW